MLVHHDKFSPLVLNNEILRIKIVRTVLSNNEMQNFKL